MKNKFVTLCAVIGISFSISHTAHAAKPFSVTVKCPVQVFDQSIAPTNLPEYYFGYAKDKNKPNACKKAEKQAKSQFPRGTKPKHCRCYDSK